MNSRMQKVDERLKAARKELTNLFKPAPNTYDAIFYDEFSKEISRLEQLAAAHYTFDSKLKERLSIRSHRDQKYGSLRFFGATLTNKLYWDLAIIAFNPANMLEMFMLMLPDIKHQITVTGSRKNNDTASSVLGLATASLDSLRFEPPHIDLLSRFIMSVSNIFDLRQIADLSHDQLIAVADMIKIKHDDLHLSMIEQYTLRQITANLLKKSSTNTPREALKQLAWQFELASPAHTEKKCSDLAGDEAFVALAAFSDYRDLLTETELQQLDAMTFYPNRSPRPISLGDFLNNSVFNGLETVDRLAHFIQDFLRRHAAPHPVLDTKAKLSTADEIKSTDEQQLLLASLLSQTDKTIKRSIEFFDHHLLSKVNAKQDYEQLYNLLTSTPSALYDLIINQHRNLPLNTYIKLIESNMLDREQVHALINALVICYKRGELLYWAVTTNRDDELNLIIESFVSDRAYFATLTNITYDTNNLLVRCTTPQQVRMILSPLPDDLRHQLIALHNLQTGTKEVHAAILEYISNYREFVSHIYHQNNLTQIITFLNLCARVNENLACALAKEIIDLARKPYQNVVGTVICSEWLPKIDNVALLRFVITYDTQDNNDVSLLTNPDRNGETIFHTSHSQLVIDHYIHQLPRKLRQTALTTRNRNHVSPLLRKDISLETFKCMLMSIPKSQRYHAITRKGDNNQDVIYVLDSALQRLPVILDAVEPHQRAQIMLNKIMLPYGGAHADCLMQDLLMRLRSDTLHKILSAIPPEDRLRALLGDGSSTAVKIFCIEKLAENHEHLKVALQLLPEQDVTTLLATTNFEQSVILEAIFRNHYRIDVIGFFLSLPVSCLSALLLTPNLLFVHLIEKLIMFDAELTQKLLLRLPEETRIRVLKLSPIRGIKFLPSAHRLPALLEESHNGLNAIQNNSYTSGLDVHEILRCISMLTDEEGYSLLSIKIKNHSLLQVIHTILCKEMRNNYFDKSFQRWHEMLADSKPCFVNDLVIIYSYLAAENERLHAAYGNCFSLFHVNPAQELMLKLDRCDNVNAAKQTLLEYMETPKTTYGDKFMRTLNKNQDIERIRKDWNASMHDLQSGNVM